MYNHPILGPWLAQRLLLSSGYVTNAVNKISHSFTFHHMQRLLLLFGVVSTLFLTLRELDPTSSYSSYALAACAGVSSTLQVCFSLLFWKINDYNYNNYYEQQPG